MKAGMVSLDDLLQAVTAEFVVVNQSATPTIRGIRTLDRAGPFDATFATSERLHEVSDTAGVVVTDAPASKIEGRAAFRSTTWIITTEPRRLIAELAGPLERRIPTGVHPTASIHESATIGPGCTIGANVAIGPGVTIGSNSTVDSGATVQDADLGSGVSVGPGTVIGSSGFGYERSGDEWIRLPHLGRVIIEDHVEIGANVCVDRGTFGDTVLRTGVKIDNLVHVAHNCVVGRNSIVTAAAMFAGSVEVGDSVWIAPATAVLNGVVIGDRAATGLGAVVIRDVPSDDLVIGVPARSVKPTS